MSARTLLPFRADSTNRLLYRGSDLFKMSITSYYKLIMTVKNCHLRAFEARLFFIYYGIVES